MKTGVKILIVMVPFLGLAAGCQTNSVSTTEPFRQIEKLSTHLVRGESTREQVLSIFGEPSGTGSSIFPPDHTRYEVWFYEDIEATNEVQPYSNVYTGQSLDPSLANALYMVIRQQWLLVFLKDNTYAGYLWSSNVGEIEGKVYSL